MRLLNVNTGLLKEFYSTESQHYAILSHTWHSEEILYHDIRDGLPAPQHGEKRGFAKIRGCCSIVAQEGLGWVWIDTCCIDKTSSAELSEAINSMYRWYEDAELCIAFLEDLSHQDADMSKCRWFERGWTLQELLAPREVLFYDQNWTSRGTKSTLASTIKNITKIPEKYLRPNNEEDFRETSSIAQRMSWASNRKTSREEDIAYCLLGLFDVSMPLLYGEGKKAFIRLQEEIIKNSTDHSLFAWGLSSLGIEEDSRDALVERFSPPITVVTAVPTKSAFARHPRDFAHSALVRSRSNLNEQYSMTNKGLQIKLPVAKSPWFQAISLIWAVLECCYGTLNTTVIAIPIYFDQKTQTCYRICGQLWPLASHVLDLRSLSDSRPMSSTLPFMLDNRFLLIGNMGSNKRSIETSVGVTEIVRITAIVFRELPSPKEGWNLINVSPKTAFHLSGENRTMRLTLVRHEHKTLSGAFGLTFGANNRAEGCIVLRGRLDVVKTAGPRHSSRFDLTMWARRYDGHESKSTVEAAVVSSPGNIRLPRGFEELRYTYSAPNHCYENGDICVRTYEEPSLMAAPDPLRGYWRSFDIRFPCRDRA